MCPIEEQKICVNCGFCCDGTLFLYACLNPGERGHLPEKIEQQSFREGGNDYFRLPCRYFSEKCTIYDSERAYVCASYRCQLLKDYAGGKLSQLDAQEIVRDAMQMRNSLLEQYYRISGDNKEINFRQLLIDLGKIQKSASENEPVSIDYEMLLAGCNIFEALLIKQIRSASDFEGLMIGEMDKAKD